ncbi:NADP-dependent phosphogluconate dehydrogenase [Tessaracoccus rhinocerotis]|uniref:6-phosphogluconate dehydrogenase, decarboxylating n=1 Tax=Tessaracoccus rhinocerotis TaxID=1689449 RepID=A0A553JZE1_9ACTN|nr:NADP-dependent phosphogluconate dehydrogenase [Tessaracoccus rhinocerotis]TRY17828.1 NADP-dependent phosphogluconate dehydrogenase [Tessaracoccus rhinocerotis]
MTFQTPEPASADIGIVGIGVMGTSLARNLARHGHAVAAYDLSDEHVAKLVTNYGHEGTFVPTATLPEFVAALRSPRVAIILVPAGNPTDSTVASLEEAMEPGDIIIDSGNTLFTDTQERAAALAETGIHFVGMGISGGEEGALTGPSMMPGGSRESYERIGPMLESIAAQVDGEPCCTHIGPDGAGHFVKTVHNGIEYADMQLIAEAYDLMRRGLGMEVLEIRDVFASWKETELDSYLIDITTDILGHTDAETGRPFVDIISDRAAQKGTGAWTVKAALDVGIPVPAIAEATFARSLSGAEAERGVISQLDVDPHVEPITGDRAELVDAIRDALLASKISAYAQGFDEIQQASIDEQWHIDNAALARIWRGGCIIRAGFLNYISDAYIAHPDLPSLLGDSWFSERIARCLPAWRGVVALSATSGIPAPAFGSSLAWYDGLRSERLPTALVQSQRDYFGSHTYGRVDKPGRFHTRWELDPRVEEQWD